MSAFSIDPQDPTANGQSIGGDRRVDRRYDLALELRWKLIRRRRVVDSGTGTTSDLSSGGVLFESERQLPPGGRIELYITWPVLLDNVAPLQLVITGRIVRAAGRRIAVRSMRHEFRTARTATEDRSLVDATGPDPSALLPHPNQRFRLQ